MEVEADGYTADGKAREQDVRDEFLRGKTGQPGVEGQHNRAVKPAPGEQSQFCPLIREPEQRLVRAKDAAGMRLEGERGRGPVECSRTLECGGNHRAMAAMHSVEISDCDDGAAQRRIRSSFAPDDDERRS